MASNSSGKSRLVKRQLAKLKQKRNQYRLGGAAAIVLLLLFLLLRAGDSLYDYEANPNLDKIGNSTLIVCLAGGKGRIQSALSLYSRGKGVALFIAGAGPKSTRDTILREFLPLEAITMIGDARRGNIIVETQSRNTIENAYAISRFLRSNPEITDVILITSSYHMRRSLLILDNALRRQVTIHPYTAKEGAGILRETWKSSLLGIGVTIEEYFKLILAKVFIPLLELF